MKRSNPNKEKVRYFNLVDHLSRGLVRGQYSHGLFVTFTYEQDSKEIPNSQIKEHITDFMKSSCSPETEFLTTIEMHADKQKHAHAIFVNENRISCFKNWKWGYADVQPIKSPLTLHMKRVSNYMYKCHEYNWQTKTYWTSIEVKS